MPIYRVDVDCTQTQTVYVEALDEDTARIAAEDHFASEGFDATSACGANLMNGSYIPKPDIIAPTPLAS